MSNPNLPATLRRAADYLEALIIQRHIAFIRWTPWYIEAMREAADEMENLRDNRVKIDADKKEET